MNLDNISTKFFLIQDLLMFLQTSVKDFRSRVTNLIFIGPSQNECVCYVHYAMCVTLCGTVLKMTLKNILLICFDGLIGLFYIIISLIKS